MTLLPVLALLAACSGPGCGSGPTVQVEPSPPLVEPVAPEPPADAWSHAWDWAVLVEVAAAEPTEGGEQLAAEDPRVIAVDGTEVQLARAAPGDTIEVVSARPGAAPAQVQVPADATGWLLATDRGLRTLSGTEAEQARTVRLALGLEPWRVLILVDTDHRPGAQHGREAEVAAQLAAAGIDVIQASATDTVGLPWSDDPLVTVDLAAVLAARQAGGQGDDALGDDVEPGQGFYVMAMAGKDPRVVAVDPPVRLMRAGSRFYEVDLMPGSGGAGNGGPGNGAKAKGGKARFQQGARSKAKGGKAPFLRGKAKGGKAAGDAGRGDAGPEGGGATELP
ncbi:MAG: hypothetical protein H6742_08190 [Alphaproteobacteria bacterium]|nr:hypothetical protein [Alphaproteobacteria bacterium]